METNNQQNVIPYYSHNDVRDNDNDDDGDKRFVKFFVVVQNCSRNALILFSKLNFLCNNFASDGFENAINNFRMGIKTSFALPYCIAYFINVP